MGKVSLYSLFEKKQQGNKFACLTAYDASFTVLLNQAGVEVILVGDTLGEVIQGQSRTIPVSLADMIYHTHCVARANTQALLMSDMPFMTYATPSQALDNCARIMQAGAHVVKLEGGAWLAETVFQLTTRGIPVCVHLGLIPQSVHKLGGYRVQGRFPEQAQQIKADALMLQEAGASLIVLECIPMSLAAEITQAVAIPTIGIGAGPQCDAQILVLYDMLGMGHKQLTFSKDFLKDASGILPAVKKYVADVNAGLFPSQEHGFN